MGEKKHGLCAGSDDVFANSVDTAQPSAAGPLLVRVFSKESQLLANKITIYSLHSDSNLKYT